MSDNERQTIASSAVDTLLTLGRDGRALCPAGTDPDQWAGDVLDDLARIAGLLDEAVTQVSGRNNDAVGAQSSTLSSVISAHRNIGLGPSST